MELNEYLMKSIVGFVPRGKDYDYNYTYLEYGGPADEKTYALIIKGALAKKFIKGTYKIHYDGTRDTIGKEINMQFQDGSFDYHDKPDLYAYTIIYSCPDWKADIKFIFGDKTTKDALMKHYTDEDPFNNFSCTKRQNFDKLTFSQAEAMLHLKELQI